MSAALLTSFHAIKKLIEALPYPLFLLDSKGRVVLFNDLVFGLAKYDDSELADRPFADLVELKKGPLPKNLRDLFDNSKQENIQAYYFAKNRRQVPVVISGSVLKTQSSGSCNFLVVVQDMRLFRRYAKQRVDQITPFLNRISLGDFSAWPTLPSGSDEFGDLLLAIDLMAYNLKGLLEENRQKTLQLEKVNEQLKNVNRRLDESRQRAELEKEKDEAILGNLTDAMIAADQHGKIMFMNAPCSRVFGLDQVKDLGKNLKQLISLYDEKGRLIDAKRMPINRVLKNGRKATGTYYLDKKMHIAVQVIVAPIKQQGHLNGVIVTFRNITKEKQIDEAKSEFVSLASHQLRTPLTGIKWLLQEVGRKGDLNQVQTEYIEDALHSNDRMIWLVNDLLNVSRLEAGSIQVHSRMTNLNSFLDGMVKEARPLARKKDQKIILKKGDSSFEAMFDPELLANVTENLVSNAIYYSPPSSTIEISFKTGKQHFEFTIKDQGMGISKKDHEHLFTKFYRSKESVRHFAKGSGLGLYLVKKVLDVCRGKIRFRSTLGRGTTFIVTLPVKGPVTRLGQKQLIRKKYFD